jgi:hypothetical protein
MAATMKQVLSDNIQNLLANESGDHVWVWYAQEILYHFEGDGGGEYDDTIQTAEYLHKSYNFFQKDKPLSLSRVKNILNILEELDLIWFSPSGPTCLDDEGNVHPAEYIRNHEQPWQY